MFIIIVINLLYDQDCFKIQRWGFKINDVCFLIFKDQFLFLDKYFIGFGLIFIKF